MCLTTSDCPILPPSHCTERQASDTPNGNLVFSKVGGYLAIIWPRHLNPSARLLLEQRIVSVSVVVSLDTNAP